jgi:hypothetical protein
MSFNALDKGHVPKYRSLARHITSGNASCSRSLSEEDRYELAQSLFKVTQNPTSNSIHGPMPPADVSFIIGQRVRVTKNLATQLGIYQGALGCVYGFLFASDSNVSDQLMWPTANSPNWKIALSRRQDNTPVILVQMDKLRKPISCISDVPNVIPFVQETHHVAILVRGMTYYRCQYPLLPAQATTMHKSQGLTAKYGAVFQPSKNGTQSHFGQHYEALSRVTSIEQSIEPPHYNNLTLLNYPLRVGHFTSHSHMRDSIENEYQRLRALQVFSHTDITFI